MAEKKKTNFVTGFSWKRTIVTVFLMLFTALAVGGVLWWVMDRNASDAKESENKSIEKLEDTISTLKEALSESTSKSAANTSATEDNSVEALKAFCYPEGVAGQQIVSMMETANGLFGNCSLDNAFLIAKKINNKWTKIWAGNGVIENSLCTQYKIPNKMSGGTCNY